MEYFVCREASAISRIQFDRSCYFKMLPTDDSETHDGKMDAVILAGGALSDDLARRTDTTFRALMPYERRTTISWTYEAISGSQHIGRVSAVGPDALREIPEIASAHLFLPESDSMESNLFAVFARLLPQGRILVSACDNPLLTTAALDDFLERCAPEAAVSLPIVRYEMYLRKFPRAPDKPSQLKDGNWLVGNCAVIHSRSIPRLQRLLPDVFKRRSDIGEIISQVGWQFAWKVKMKRVTLEEVQNKVCEAAAIPIRLIKDCDPVLAFDIDSVEQWDYLRKWAGPVSGVGSRV